MVDTADGTADDSTDDAIYDSADNDADGAAGGTASKYNSMACVFQEPARFNTFTIADNVFLGDVDKERDENAIDTVLHFAGFEGADKNAMLGKDIGGTELSGGQWQKLAIAWAYYRNRDFIILDEHTSNLVPWPRLKYSKSI